MIAAPQGAAGLLIYDNDHLAFDAADHHAYIVCETAAEIEAAFATDAA